MDLRRRCLEGAKAEGDVPVTTMVDGNAGGWAIPNSRFSLEEDRGAAKIANVAPETALRYPEWTAMNNANWQIYKQRGRIRNYKPEEQRGLQSPWWKLGSAFRVLTPRGHLAWCSHTPQWLG